MGDGRGQGYGRWGDKFTKKEEGISIITPFPAL